MVAMRWRSEDAEAGMNRLVANAPNAVARALNRSIVTGRVFMRRAVASDIGLQQGVVDKDFTVMEARPEKLTATLEVQGKRIPLVKFPHSGPLPSRGRPPYVMATVGGATKTYPNAFMARMRSGHTGIFTRVPPSVRMSRGAWSKNLPIVELRGPSLVRVFIKHLADGYAHAEAALANNLEHELAFAMRNATV